jgi:hypothetical protein
VARQEAWAKEPVNFHRCPDDFVSDFVVGHEEKNLTQRTQREEGTEFTEKRTEKPVRLRSWS